MTTSMSEARTAKETVKHLLAGVEGVSGIGITWNENGIPAVQVNVQKHALAAAKATLQKHPVDVPIVFEEIGEITFRHDRG